MNLTDYLILFVLLLLLVTLSFPTITQLTAILRGGNTSAIRTNLSIAPIKIFD
jgi:hypothetical protein